MFRLQILFQNGDCGGLAEYGLIISMDRTGRHNGHACPGQEKGGEINSLVRILESLIFVANLYVNGWLAGLWASLNSMRVRNVTCVGRSRSAQDVCSRISQFGAIVSLQKVVGY